MTSTLDTLKRAHQLQRQGSPAKAEGLYRQVLKSEPNNIHALNLLGALCVNSRRPEEAIKLIQKSLSIRPKDPQALVNYALALKDVSRSADAMEALKQALALEGANILALNILGGLLLDSGSPGDAIAPYSKVVEIDKNSVAGWINLSSAFKEVKDYERAIESVQRSLALDSKSGSAHKALAEVYRAQGQLEGAIEQFKHTLALDPENASAVIALAHTYREAEQTELALATLNELINTHPHSADAHEAIGLLHEQLGQRDLAAESFKKTIAIAPARAFAHYQLAQLKGRQPTSDEVQALDTLLASRQLTSGDRRYALFALAVIRDKNKHYDEAFAAWSAANAIQAEKSPYQPKVKEEYYQSLVSCLSPLLRELDNSSDNSTDKEARPVFIIGMPRSGTTLAGQILASHSRVTSLGEVSFAYDMAAQVKTLTGTDYPQGVKDLTKAHCQTLAEAYIKRYAGDQSSASCVLDITPLNFQHVGLLGLVFPRARFIYCQRDPIDTCFSIFKLPFSSAQNYAHDLKALGHQYSQTWALMNEWKKLMPDRILDVRYEETVEDLEGQSRKMLDFLGLSFEDAVLEFYRSNKIVRTPSASQVRQPIYRDALEAWKKYERHLSPLIEAIQIES